MRSRLSWDADGRLMAEQAGDVMGAAFCFLANLISKSCPEDAKEAFVFDEFAENLKLAVWGGDGGHGYKISVEMEQPLGERWWRCGEVNRGNAEMNGQGILTMKILR